jgi:hypothetical protein
MGLGKVRLVWLLVASIKHLIDVFLYNTEKGRARIVKIYNLKSRKR